MRRKGGGRWPRGGILALLLVGIDEGEMMETVECFVFVVKLGDPERVGRRGRVGGCLQSWRT